MAIGIKIIGKEKGRSFQRIYYEEKFLCFNEFRGCADIDVLRKLFPIGSGFHLILRPRIAILNPIGMENCTLNDVFMENNKTYQIKVTQTLAFKIGDVELFINAFIA